MISASLTLGLCFLGTFTPLTADAQTLRAEAKRLRNNDHGTEFYNNKPRALGEDSSSLSDASDAQDEKLEEWMRELHSGGSMTPPTATPPFFTPAPVTVGPSAPSTPTFAPSQTSTGLDPTGAPVSTPDDVPTAAPIVGNTAGPTVAGCMGMTEDERIDGILAELDTVADPDLIRDNSTPQGLATTWLIEETGQFRVCPGEDNTCGLVQRWALAVIYYSTNGDDWFQCSASPTATTTTTTTDACGMEEPFIGDSRFLSDNSECNWAGISCIQGCVTEIEFELNNLVGTIPTEIGLMDKLRVWGMERGGLSGRIPTEIGKLSNLIFLDLDFNALTGSLSSELLTLANLEQLDLNDNNFTGSVSGIGVFPKLEFLQVHRNFFTGTVPESLGESSLLSAFTLHETGISGTMPESVCNLLESRGNGGVLTSMIADCSPPNPDIVCTCCTDCRKA